MGQKLPLMLCLDTSGSMQGAPVESLNEALADWGAELRADVQWKTTVQVAMVTFGAGGVRVWQGSEPFTPGSAVSPFVPASEFYPPRLQAGGVTLLTEATELALRHVYAYKGWLKEQGLTYYRPLIFLLTDGIPTDETGHESQSWQRLVPYLESGRRDNGFEFYAIGVGNLTPQGQHVLSTLVPGGFRILGGFPFRTLLRLLSATIEKVVGGSGADAPLLTGAIGEPDPFDSVFGQFPADE
jgi:uncharacterized protein YegL